METLESMEVVEVLEKSNDLDLNIVMNWRPVT